MCDVALDRSGRTRPEPKIHNEATATAKVSPSPGSHAPNSKPIPAAAPHVPRANWKKQDIEKQEFSGHLWAIFGQIVLIVLTGWVLVALPRVGLLLLIIVGGILMSPARVILAYLFRSRAGMGILALLLLIGIGVHWFVSEYSSGKIARPSFLAGILPLPKPLSSQGASSRVRGADSLDGPFYLIQEFFWPDTEGVKYVWPMPTHGACEELLNKNKDGRILGQKPAEKCVPDKGQYDSFFRYEPNPDWYATFQSSGKVSNFGIFKLSDSKQQLGAKNVFHPVWLFVKSMLSLAKKQNPPITLTAHIISPQGEVDMDTWRLKK